MTVWSKLFQKATPFEGVYISRFNGFIITALVVDTDSVRRYGKRGLGKFFPNKQGISFVEMSAFLGE